MTHVSIPPSRPLSCLADRDRPMNARQEYNQRTSSQSIRTRSCASLLIAILGFVAAAPNARMASANQILRPIDLARILDSKSFHVVVRTAEIPRLPLVSAKIIRLNQPMSQALVDPGKPYQSGDDVEGDYPPSRRLVFAGISRDYILICFSKGGMAVSQNILLLHRTTDHWAAVFAAILNATQSVTNIDELKRYLKHGNVIAYSPSEEDWSHN